MPSFQTELALIKQSLENIKSELSGFVSRVECENFKEDLKNFVTKDQFEPVRNLVFGAVGIILVSAIGALLSLIIRK